MSRAWRSSHCSKPANASEFDFTTVPMALRANPEAVRAMREADRLMGQDSVR